MSTTARYFISPVVRSNSDEDGTTLLHITDNKIYGLVGVASLIWEKFSKSHKGLAAHEIVSELRAEFDDVSQQQIEDDVSRLLNSFEQKHLIEAARRVPALKACLSDCFNDSLLLISNATIGLLLCLRMYVFATVIAFTFIDVVLKLLGFKHLHNLIKHWPTAETDTPSETQEQIWDKISRGITWYPRQVMCLQRSAVTTWLLRSSGIPAQMVIGCQRRPFLVHAWTEANGVVVNDRQSVRDVHEIIERC